MLYEQSYVTVGCVNGTIDAEIAVAGSVVVVDSGAVRVWGVWTSICFIDILWVNISIIHFITDLNQYIYWKTHYLII